jgi:hypothetical protein
MAYKPVVLLLAKEASHVALGKLDLAKRAEDEYVEARVPKPLELVTFFRRHDIAIVGTQEGRVSFPHVGEHDCSDDVFEMILSH